MKVSYLAPMLAALPTGMQLLRIGAMAMALLMATPTVEAGTFTNVASMANARSVHTATLMPSGTILVVGGQKTANLTYLASVELYDPATDSWQQIAPLSFARRHHTATLLPSGKVLVAGGDNAGGALNSAELYDPDAGIWFAAAPLAQTNYLHTATLLSSGKVLVAGGVAGAIGGIYDPAGDTWTSTGPMPGGRYAHTATLLNSGKVLVAGGISGSNALKTAALYDPATNSWSPAGSLAAARLSHQAILLASGRVLVVGGNNSNAGTVLASAEIYDPVTDSWAPAAPMTHARTVAAGVLLRSGKVLVTGGLGGGQLGSAELYDPASNTWSDQGPMASPRWAHTATALPSGKVLIAAGDNQSSLQSAEIYDPTSTVSISVVSPEATVTGQAYAVSFSARTAIGLASGSVIVTDDQGGQCGPVVLSAGSGSCMIASSVAGNRTLTAAYTPGDGSLEPSTASAVHLVVAAATRLTVVETPEPAHPADPVIVSVMVNIQAPGMGLPTGSITVTQADSGMSCTFDLPDSQCTLPPSAAGIHELTAEYSGDANFLPDMATWMHTVEKYASEVAIDDIIPATSVVGQPVSVAYMVLAPDGVPTGTVTVLASTGESCSGSVAAGHCSLIFMVDGNRTLSAEYAGDASHAADISSVREHAVDDAATILSITSHTPDPSLPFEMVSVSATLTVASPGSGIPVGAISVSDGSNSCLILQSGGECELAMTTRGPHTLTATYGSDGNYASSSTQVVHHVNRLPVAPAASYSMAEDSSLVAGIGDGVLAGASDPDGDELAVANAGTFDASGIGGVVALAADGSYSYTPPADANGTATFDYVVSDGRESVTATATITVTAVNDAPSFALATILDWPAGASGVRTQAGFANVVSFGAANEAGQHVRAWHVRTINDPTGVASSVSIALDGTLSYTLSGHAGSAMFGLTLQDDGDTANGGNDTSGEQTFTINVAAGLDLSISIDDATDFAPGGGTVVYVIVVHNAGPNDAIGATVKDLLPTNLVDASWTCEAGVGASCTPSGSGDIDDTVTIPSGATLTYVLGAHVVADPESPVANTVSVIAPANVPDANAANDAATDTDTVGIFADGFDQAGAAAAAPSIVKRQAQR